MVRRDEVRAGETAVTPPPATDAGLVFVGRIHTPWADRLECPRQGRLDGPTCRIEIFPPWVPALDDMAEFERLEVIYWLHLSRRDLVRQSPANDGTARGTFSLRTPVRPNPIGTSIVRLVEIDGPNVMVRPRLPRRNAAPRPEAGSDAVHPDRAAPTGRRSGGR